LICEELLLFAVACCNIDVFSMKTKRKGDVYFQNEHDFGKENIIMIFIGEGLSIFVVVT